MKTIDAMRPLELASFPVGTIQFGPRTSYENGNLVLDRAGLLAEIKQDGRIAVADMQLALPGDHTRIVGVRDVVEPRTKAGESGSDFPGIIGPIQTAGEGRTNRLSGTAVVTAARYQSGMRTGTGAPTASVLDMWGPGAAITPFGSTRNVVLLLGLAGDLPEYDAHDTIQRAEFRLAQRLAETSLEGEPASTEKFELVPVSPELPKVVYVLGYVSTPWNPHPGVALYGLPVRESLPTLLHPNEFLDGAVTPDARRGEGSFTRTWDWQNHPVILGLYREHGKRLNFLGVIFQRVHFQTYGGKEVGALRTAELARMTGAQAAIVTRMVVSGNMLIDSTLAVAALEKAGIKTVFLTPEYGGKEGDELPLLFTLPEEDAITSSGSFERKLELPAPSLVLGPGGSEVLMDLDRASGKGPPSAYGAMQPDGWDIVTGGIDWWGRGKLSCEEY